MERLMKRRHECYLEENVSERPATMAAKPGSSKTAIMANALRAYFDQRAGTTRRTVQSSARQLSLQLGRIERDQQIVAQTLALPADFSSCSLRRCPTPIEQRRRRPKIASRPSSSRSVAASPAVAVSSKMSSR